MSDHYIIIDKSFYSKSFLLYSPKYRKRYKLYLDMYSKYHFNDFEVGDHIKYFSNKRIKKIHLKKESLPLFAEEVV